MTTTTQAVTYALSEREATVVREALNEWVWTLQHATGPIGTRDLVDTERLLARLQGQVGAPAQEPQSTMAIATREEIEAAPMYARLVWDVRRAPPADLYDLFDEWDLFEVEPRHDAQVDAQLEKLGLAIVLQEPQWFDESRSERSSGKNDLDAALYALASATTRSLVKVPRVFGETKHWYVLAVDVE
jgi:hypothetical protein